MWKKISALISILCIASYILVGADSALKIAEAVSERRIIAEQEFASVQDLVRSAGRVGFSSADIEKEVRAAVARAVAIDAVIVSGEGFASFAVEKPGAQIIASDFNNSYRFNTQWKLYRKPLTAYIDAGRLVTLQALSGFIDAGRLLEILRSALFAVMLAVMAAFLTLMLDILVFGKDKKPQEADKEADRMPTNRMSTDRMSEDNSPAEKTPPKSPPEIPKESADKLSVDGTSVDRLPVEKMSADRMHVNDKTAPPLEDNDDEADRISSDVPSADAMSADSRFDGELTEMYFGLIQKLNEELSGSYGDLALFSIHWTETVFSETEKPLAKSLAEEAARYFNIMGISAFKRGESGVFLVLPGVSFKESVRLARSYHAYIMRDSALKKDLSSIKIGITTRAGRDINPERLIFEAEKAAEKAAEDPKQPITAFKADPVKFRGFQQTSFQKTKDGARRG